MAISHLDKESGVFRLNGYKTPYFWLCFGFLSLSFNSFRYMYLLVIYCLLPIYFLKDL